MQRNAFLMSFISFAPRRECLNCQLGSNKDKTQEETELTGYDYLPAAKKQKDHFWV